MCRWLAYTGNPIQLETVLFRAKHSLIDHIAENVIEKS